MLKSCKKVNINMIKLAFLFRFMRLFTKIIDYSRLEFDPFQICRNCASCFWDKFYYDKTSLGQYLFFYGRLTRIKQLATTVNVL